MPSVDSSKYGGFCAPACYCFATSDDRQQLQTLINAASLLCLESDNPSLWSFTKDHVVPIATYHTLIQLPDFQKGRNGNDSNYWEGAEANIWSGSNKGQVQKLEIGKLVHNEDREFMNWHWQNSRDNIKIVLTKTNLRSIVVVEQNNHIYDFVERAKIDILDPILMIRTGGLARPCGVGELGWQKSDASMLEDAAAIRHCSQNISFWVMKTQIIWFQWCISWCNNKYHNIEYCMDRPPDQNENVPAPDIYNKEFIEPSAQNILPCNKRLKHIWHSDPLSVHFNTFITMEYICYSLCKNIFSSL